MFLAMIIPIDPSQVPTHPIAPGGQPPGIWGGSGQPFPGYGLPGTPPGIWGGAPPIPTHPIAPGGPPPTVGGGPIYPPGIWPSPGHPAHPIAPGGPPPGYWGGGGVPMPTPPIYFPDDKPPGTPPGIWGGGNTPLPTPPIELPPDLPPTLPPDPEKPDVEGPKINWKVGWTPVTGWVIVGIPEGTLPTPSKK